MVFPHRKPKTFTYYDNFGNTNEAEMMACVKAVQWADINDTFDIFTDSQSAENTLIYGLSRNMRQNKIKELFEKAIVDRNLDVTVTWIPRAGNKADAPSKIQKWDKFKHKLDLWN